MLGKADIRCDQKAGAATKWRRPIGLVVFFAFFLCLTAGCVSFPIARERIDQIAAVGWLSDDEPIAIAQDVTWYRGWYPMTPDGTGVFDRLTARCLVLLSLDDRITVSFSPGRRFWLERAAFVPSLKSFVAIVTVDTPGTLWGTARCLIVAKDGSYRDCHLPKPPGDFEFSPDAREFFVGHFVVPSDDYPLLYAYDYITDESRNLTGMLPQAILSRIEKTRPAWVPCKAGFSNRRLSPDSSILAFSCQNESRQLEIWIADESGNSSQVIPIEDSRAPLQHTEFDLDSYYSYPLARLAWSPDQQHLYFCRQPGSTGYVVAVDGTSQLTHRPCMIAAEWSPSGKKIAGILDNQLTVWSPPEWVR